MVGFDDIPEAEFFTPPLTTVRQDFNEMGRRALHLLLAEISTGTRSRTRAIVPGATDRTRQHPQARQVRSSAISTSST